MKRTLALILALLLTMSLVVGCGNKPAADDGSNDAVAEDNLQKSLAIDISDVRGTDGRLLLEVQPPKDIPARPEDPSALPETDPLHWYDMEYAGMGEIDKSKVVKSPADGCIGKELYLIVTGDHPWTTAYVRGSEIAAEAYGMTLNVLNPNYDLNVQNQMIDQAINARPDAIIIMFLDAEAAVQQARKVNEAGIPCFGSTLQPPDAGMEYLVGYAGPDDFANSANIANYMGEKAGGEGGICYVTHLPGSSTYYGRFNRHQAELAVNYPNIKTLDVASPGFDADATYQVVADWITRFGDELTMIYLADDSAQMTGAALACEDAGRSDIMICAAGNSKVGMDTVKEGKATAITEQSAEGGGAISIRQCAEYFNGLDVAPMALLPLGVIDASNVEEYYPAQW